MNRVMMLRKFILSISPIFESLDGASSQLLVLIQEVGGPFGNMCLALTMDSTVHLCKLRL
jgi:hypothetical protein